MATAVPAAAAVVVVAAAAAAAVVAAAGAEELVDLLRGRCRVSDLDASIARLSYPLDQGNGAAVQLWQKKSDKSHWSFFV
jgi:hypothetical protein